MSRGSAPNAGQLTDYLLLVRRQWLVIVAGLLLGAALAAAYLSVAPREYSAATSVLVTAPTSGSAATSRTAEINLDTEARLVTSTETVAAAAELLESSGDDAADLADLAGRVTVTVPPNTEILTITFVAPSAEGARAGAEAFAAAYLQARFDSAGEALDAEDKALQERIDEIREQLDQVTTQVVGLPAGSAERSRLDAQASSLNSQLAALGSQQNAVRSSAASPGQVVTQPGCRRRRAAPTSRSSSSADWCSGCSPASRRPPCATTPTTGSGRLMTCSGAPGCPPRPCCPRRCTRARSPSRRPRARTAGPSRGCATW